jgi:hypothetical protein
MKFSWAGIRTDMDGRKPAGRPGPQLGGWIAHVRQLVITATVILGALSLGTAAGAAAAPGSSADAPNFSAEPYGAQGAQQRSEFSYQLLPGHRILDQLVIKNTSNATKSFLVYGEDATNVLQTGGYAYEQRSRMHNTLVGRWLSIGTSNVTVPSGKEVVDTFALSIPSNAPPGDHVGAVVAEEVNGPSQRTNGVNVVLRIAVPTYVRVVGKSYPGLTVENLNAFHDSPVIPFVGSSKVGVKFDLANTGNDILNPKSVTVSITGLLSGTIHTYTLHQTGATQSRANPLPVQMLPGARVTLAEEWSGIPPFDPLTASVTATAIDPSTTQHLSTTASTSFWYFPWILVLIVLALIAGAIALIRRRRRAAASSSSPGPDNESGGKAVGITASTADSETLQGADI